MRIQLENVKRIGRRIGLDEEKGYLVAIFLALIIVSATIIGYYAVVRPQPEPYNTMYLLDSNKKAIDYPETLVVNQNSTFNVYVVVVNHMGGSENQTYQVLLKITPNLTDLPLSIQPTKSFEISLRNEDSWEDLVSITLNQVGSYSVVFELWQEKSGIYEFTHNYCVLPVEVIILN